MHQNQGPSKESIEKARQAVSRLREQKNRKKELTAVIAGAPLIALLWYINMQHDTSQDAYAAPVMQTCADSDAACLAEKWLAQSTQPCSTALEGQLQFIPTWTDSWTQPRFVSTGWYEPMNSVIYTGNAIEVVNAFGAKSRAQYFCVVSVRTGTVIKAGFPSL